MQITPDTKVAELLKHYPQLEEILIKFSPAFAALKNPVLRRTVAKVTSLQQAAKVGNANIVEMINALRKEMGQPILEGNFNSESKERDILFSEKAPETSVIYTLDVRPIIKAGDHPKDTILIQAEKLQSGECLKLITPFPPTPLIDLLKKKGYRITMLTPQDGIVKTFVER